MNNESTQTNNESSRLTYANKSYQSGIKGDIYGNDPNALGLGVVSDKITNYSLFQGGLNATHDALVQYDPLKTGFGRLFMIRTPPIVEPSEMKILKHILEYANTEVSGLGDIQLDSTDMEGGYTKRSIPIPTVSQDNTKNFSIKVYEMAGSPVTRTIRSWINGISDVQSGLSHSNGMSADGFEPTLANQSAEFVYVVTDSSGRWDRIEYACLFACCIPTKISLDHFNYSAGNHELVQQTIEFNCIKYDGPQVNQIAKILMKKYNSLVNSLDFYPGISIIENDLYSGSMRDSDNKVVMADVVGEDVMYNPTNGKIEAVSNVPKEYVEDMVRTGYMAQEDEREQRKNHASSSQDTTRTL